MKVFFEVYGKPQGKARPRMTRSGHVYTPHETLQYEQRVRSAYQSACDCKGYFRDEPVRVVINVFYDIPKSTPKKMLPQILRSNLLPTKKPDTDNIAKIICDALNGVAYGDDKQIVELHVYKWYTASEARVTVYIDEVQHER